MNYLYTEIVIPSRERIAQQFVQGKGNQMFLYGIGWGYLFSPVVFETRVKNATTKLLVRNGKV